MENGTCYFPSISPNIYYTYGSLINVLCSSIVLVVVCKKFIEAARKQLLSHFFSAVIVNFLIVYVTVGHWHFLRIDFQNDTVGDLFSLDNTGSKKKIVRTGIKRKELGLRE